MSKHTRGEWKSYRTFDYDKGWQIETDDGYRVAMVPNASEKPENEANARLITAAPDLLEALRLVMDYPDVRSYLGRIVSEQADAAIAKAREQQ